MSLANLKYWDKKDNYLPGSQNYIINKPLAIIHFANYGFRMIENNFRNLWKCEFQIIFQAAVIHTNM